MDATFLVGSAPLPLTTDAGTTGVAGLGGLARAEAGGLAGGPCFFCGCGFILEAVAEANTSLETGGGTNEG
jgi:hypothetical protein